MSDINIVGLGSAGCSIATEFERYPQYNVYKIDKEGEKSKNFYTLKDYNHPEKYEINPPKLKTFFKKIKGEVLFIVSGAGIVSGASLVILEQLKNCDVSILYIKPDVDLLSEIRTLQERLVYNVLQEYTRSGVFKNMFIVDNNKMEDLLGDLPLKEYYQKINQAIVSSIHTINIFKNSRSVMDNFSCCNETSRIATIAAVNFEDGEERMFFGLDAVREKCYYFGVNKEVVEKDNKLFSKIKEQIKKKRTGDIKVSYGVFQTEHEDSYAFCVLRSSKIQE